MDPEFWHAKWRENQIGFHLDRPNDLLTELWPTMGLSTNAAVFVPLCGKSKDLYWLRQRGHPVLGVELSEMAVAAFFKEHNLPCSTIDVDGMHLTRGDGIEIYCGDLFQLEPSRLAAVQAVYDRAALIAFPPNDQERYAERLQAIVPDGVPVLCITLEYAPSEMQGPPFSVDEAQMQRLFGHRYSINLLLDRDALVPGEHLHARGLTWLREKAYRLVPKQA